MEIIKKEYPNKLRSVSVLSKDTQSVTVMFLVGVGSRYETDQEAGLAHFVEHTLFKGTEKRPSSKKIGTEIESLGGSSNAFTSQDYTGYYIKAPAENFEKTFAVLADMFRNSKFDEHELEKEKGVIVEEIKMYEDRPASKVSMEWMSNFFAGNNLGKDIAGTIDSVKAMKRDQFFEYMRKHYYSENIVVVVSGNVEQNTVENVINEHCSDLETREQRGVEPSTIETFNFEQSVQNIGRNVHIPKDLQQAHVIIGGKSLERDHPQRFALQVGNSILADGFGSRLFQVIRDELGLAYYVFSRIVTFNEVGVFQVGMGVDSERADEAIAAAKVQMNEVVEGKFTQEEFDRAKNYMLGQITTGLESSDDIASFYGMQELLNKERLTISDIREKIKAVTLDEVHEATKNVFTADNYFQTILSK